MSAQPSIATPLAEKRWADAFSQANEIAWNLTHWDLEAFREAGQLKRLVEAELRWDSKVPRLLVDMNEADLALLYCERHDASQEDCECVYRALRNYRKLAENASGPGLYYLYLEAGDFQEAAKALETVGPVYFGLPEVTPGQMYERIGNIDAARRFYEKIGAQGEVARLEGRFSMQITSERLKEAYSQHPTWRRVICIELQAKALYVGFDDAVGAMRLYENEKSCPLVCTYLAHWEDRADRVIRDDTYEAARFMTGNKSATMCKERIAELESSLRDRASSENVELTRKGFSQAAARDNEIYADDVDEWLRLLRPTGRYAEAIALIEDHKYRTDCEDQLPLLYERMGKIRMALSRAEKFGTTGQTKARLFLKDGRGRAALESGNGRGEWLREDWRRLQQISDRLFGVRDILQSEELASVLLEVIEWRVDRLCHLPIKELFAAGLDDRIVWLARRTGYHEYIASRLLDWGAVDLVRDVLIDKTVQHPELERAIRSFLAHVYETIGKYDEVALKREARRAACKGTQSCHCGELLLDSFDFCPKCGSPRCCECRSTIDRAWRFCPSCGAAVKT